MHVVEEMTTDETYKYRDVVLDIQGQIGVIKVHYQFPLPGLDFNRRLSPESA